MSHLFIPGTDNNDDESVDHSSVVLKEELADDAASEDLACEWPQADIITLLSRIETQLPKPDNHAKFSKTLQRMNWDSIKFNNYSSEECKECAERVIHKVTLYRTKCGILC